jgi:hypothetical protein
MALSPIERIESYRDEQYPTRTFAGAASRKLLSGMDTGMPDRKWQLANGNWQMAIGKWQMANGNWQLAIGNWRAGGVSPLLALP